MRAAPQPLDDDHALEALLDYLKRSRGFNFTGYKRSSIVRRLTRRRQLQQNEELTLACELAAAERQRYQELFDHVSAPYPTALR